MASVDKVIIRTVKYPIMLSFYLNDIEKIFLERDAACGSKLQSKSLLEIYYTVAHPYQVNKLKCTGADNQCDLKCLDEKQLKYVSCLFQDKEQTKILKEKITDVKFSLETGEEFGFNSAESNWIRESLREMIKDFGSP